MNPAIICSNSYLAVRVWDHLRLGLSSEIQVHEKNITERIGDVGLWPVQNLPRLAWNFASDPKVITVAITAFAMLADSYCFYPDHTYTYVKMAWDLLPEIPFWAIKFATYVATIETIASCGARAEGRFANKELMTQFYAPLNG